MKTKILIYLYNLYYILEVDIYFLGETLFLEAFWALQRGVKAIASKFVSLTE